MNHEGYQYFKLQKERDGVEGLFDDVAVSREPIMRESAYLFGPGHYKIILATERYIEKNQFGDRRYSSDPGSFHESTLIEFYIDETYDNPVPVDLDKLNLNIVSSMMEKVKEALQLDQKRSIQK